MITPKCKLAMSSSLLLTAGMLLSCMFDGSSRPTGFLGLFILLAWSGIGFWVTANQQERSRKYLKKITTYGDFLRLFLIWVFSWPIALGLTMVTCAYVTQPEVPIYWKVLVAILGNIFGWTTFRWWLEVISLMGEYRAHQREINRNAVVTPLRTVVRRSTSVAVGSIVVKRTTTTTQTVVNHIRVGGKQ